MSKKIEKLLNEWGFTKHERLCDQPSGFGHCDEDGMFVDDGCKVIEEWSNKEIAEIIADELKPKKKQKRSGLETAKSDRDLRQ